jgi:outer membrane lipoprotein
MSSIKNVFSIVFSTLLLLITLGCSRHQVIPTHLENHINRDVSYEQIKASPDKYRGQLIVWGGEVLKVTRDTDRIVVEILRLPLNNDLTPAESRTSSQGRFLGYVNKGEIIDQALLQEGTTLTVIGEVKGMQETTGNQAANEYPRLAIRDMTAWYSSWP